MDAGSARDLGGHFAGSIRRNCCAASRCSRCPCRSNFYFGQARFTPEGESGRGTRGSGQGAERRKPSHHWPHRSAGRSSIQCRIVQTAGGGCADYLISTRREGAHPGGRQGTGRAFSTPRCRRPVTREEGWALDRRVEWVRRERRIEGVRHWTGMDGRQTDGVLIAAASQRCRRACRPRAVLSDDLRAAGRWDDPRARRRRRRLLAIAGVGAVAGRSSGRRGYRRGAASRRRQARCSFRRRRDPRENRGADGLLSPRSKPGDFVLFRLRRPRHADAGIPAMAGHRRRRRQRTDRALGFSFSGDGVGEIIVNPEIRAWLSRLDAKGVDALVIMDSCFGGGMLRSIRAPARSVRGSCASADRIRAGKSMREICRHPS